MKLVFDVVIWLPLPIEKIKEEPVGLLMVAVKLPSQVLHELDGATFDTKIGGEVFDPPPEQGIFSWVE